MWSYDIDEEAWDAIEREAAKKDEPIRCVCGRVATDKCPECKMITCDSSYCRAAHRRDYHSRYWMQRL